MTVMPPDQPPADVPDLLNQFTLDLISDLNDLRSNKITTSEARVRTQLAREVLRSIHLRLQGMKYLSESAKQLPAPNSNP